jgi:voltage-gated potassium channel
MLKHAESYRALFRPADRDCRSPLPNYGVCPVGRMKSEVVPDYMTPALERWRDLTSVPLLVVAVGTLPWLVLETQATELLRQDQILLSIVNLVVLVAFAADFVVGMALSSNRRGYARQEWVTALIVVAQVAALLPTSAGFGALRVLRAGRALRAAAVALRFALISSIGAQRLRRTILTRAGSFAFGLAGLTWVSSAVAFALAEGVGPQGRISSFFDALWWSLVTLATVGYGDIYPVTAAGRIIAGVTMLVGIAVFATVTAKVAQLLVREDASQ